MDLSNLIARMTSDEIAELVVAGDLERKEAEKVVAARAVAKLGRSITKLEA